MAPKGWTGDEFYAVLDIVLPDGAAGYLVVLKAYFDASERANGTFCVAGYAFTKAQVKKFDKAWWRLFGKYGGCHMTDLANKNGAFSSISDKEARRLIKEAVAIINKRISYAAVISCNVHEMEALLPRWIVGFKGAYPVCCHLAMHAMGNIVREQEPSRIAYAFESGDRYQGEAHAFMSRVLDTPTLKDSYRHSSHSFVDKDDALALQAADILAWEWAKFRDETLDQRKRLMRLSLMNLLGPDGNFKSDQYTGIHATGEPLRKFCAQVEELGLMQLREDAANRPGLAES